MTVKLHWYPITLAMIVLLFIGISLGQLYPITYAPDINREYVLWLIFGMSWMMIFFIWLGYWSGKRSD